MCRLVVGRLGWLIRLIRVKQEGRLVEKVINRSIRFVNKSEFVDGSYHA